MRRRAFIRLVGGAAATWPLAARAQQSTIPVVGLLASGAEGSGYTTVQIRAIKQGLHDNGLVENRDYVLNVHFAAGKYERFPEMARDLAQAGARVMLVNTISSVRAAQDLRPQIPVVMISINDPVGAGLIASLAQPGGYTTGMANLNEDVTFKLLDFQREIIPRAKTIAALFNPANSTNPRFLDQLRGAAGTIGITVLPAEFKPDTLEAVFTTIAAQHPDALHILSDSGLYDVSDRIGAFALTQGLPSFSTNPSYVEFNGLMAYGASREQLFIRSGYYVKRILDGAKPGDLPVEQPTRVELTVNLKTAKALKLEIPTTLLSRADKVIE